MYIIKESEQLLEKKIQTQLDSFHDFKDVTVKANDFLDKYLHKFDLNIQKAIRYFKINILKNNEFIDEDKLYENYSIKNILNETSTTEFFKQNNNYFVNYNSKKYLLKNFVRLAKVDTEVAKVILAIKKKKQSLNFEGDIEDFIKKVFCNKYHSEIPDVFVRNGSLSNDCFATFDTKEIEKNLVK